LSLSLAAERDSLALLRVILRASPGVALRGAKPLSTVDSRDEKGTSPFQTTAGQPTRVGRSGKLEGAKPPRMLLRLP